MKLFIIALTLAVTVSAIPSVEQLPEDSFEEANGIVLVSGEVTDPRFHGRMHAEAKAQIDSLLQEGKDMGACASLAGTAEKEITDSVAAQQKILDALDTGDGCSKKGQGAVDSASAGVEKAEKDLADAEAAYGAAQSAPIQFAPKGMNVLTPGQCGVFFSDGAYTGAVTARNEAKKTVEKRKGGVTQANEALSNAKTAQAELIKECQCAVATAYENAWAAATANNDENTKAYTKAKHMECVLAGKDADDCEVGEVPEVKPITLAEGVSKDACPVPTPQPTPNPTPVPTPQPTKAFSGDCGKMHKAPANLQTKSGWTICYLKGSDPQSDRTAQCKTLVPHNGKFGCWHYHSNSWNPSNGGSSNPPTQACGENTQQSTSYSGWGGTSHYLVACIKN